MNATSSGNQGLRPSRASRLETSAKAFRKEGIIFRKLLPIVRYTFTLRTGANREDSIDRQSFTMSNPTTGCRSWPFFTRGRFIYATTLQCAKVSCKLRALHHQSLLQRCASREGTYVQPTACGLVGHVLAVVEAPLFLVVAMHLIVLVSLSTNTGKASCPLVGDCLTAANDSGREQLLLVMKVVRRSGLLLPVQTAYWGLLWCSALSLVLGGSASRALYCAT